MAFKSLGKKVKFLIQPLGLGLLTWYLLLHAYVYIYDGTAGGEYLFAFPVAVVVTCTSLIWNEIKDLKNTIRDK